jgi:alcohol dehydrogenase (cytochrome c)
MRPRPPLVAGLGLLLCARAGRVTAQVPYQRIVEADREPGQWLSYSRTYDGQRHSPLDQITPANVQRLRPVWIFQAEAPGVLETSPLYVDGALYVTEPGSQVQAVKALDARTGRVLWKYERPLPKNLVAIGFPGTNRGAAVLESTLYVGTLDAHLVALDARSGVVRWDVEVASNATGHCITGAPLAIDGMVVVGISGGDAGIRGFLDAYDAKTGARRWRRWTIPEPGEPGHETWAGDSWKTGGGPTWVTGSYDPELRLVYWGTGNPGPIWNGDDRPGDNLYTNSLLAVDADTGWLRWHFQFTPHDTHDWDATHVPVLIDAVHRGRPRKLVAVANRNAFFYVLDRETGEFLLGAPYAKQTWADGLDVKGRPIVRAGSDPSVEGSLVWPSRNGATLWFSPSYSPKTGLLYVAARDKGSIYFKAKAEYKPGTPFLGGGDRNLAVDQESGAIRALEPESGRVRWEFPLLSPPWAGVMSTGGGLVFGSADEGSVFALDAATGRPLWDFQTGQTGGRTVSNPVSFLVDGRQLVTFTAGRTLIAFGLGE